MNDDVKAFLDGDLELDALPPDAREEARMWIRALRTADDTTPESAPPWLEDRIMAEVQREGDDGRRHWLNRSFTVRVTPLRGMLAAAAVAVIALIGRSGGEPTAHTAALNTVYVQFVLEAPGATSVAVAGDFSEWEDRYTLEDLDGDGVWTGRVPMVTGVHKYMFVIDGVDWVTDPNAQHYADDGFGNRNAVIAVESSVAASNS
jgi:hypothetical protein